MLQSTNAERLGDKESSAERHPDLPGKRTEEILAVD